MNVGRANAPTSIAFIYSIYPEFITLSIDISGAIYAGLPLQRLTVPVFSVNTRVWIILDRASPRSANIQVKGFFSK